MGRSLFTIYLLNYTGRLDVDPYRLDSLRVLGLRVGQRRPDGVCETVMR